MTILGRNQGFSSQKEVKEKSATTFLWLQWKCSDKIALREKGFALTHTIQGAGQLKSYQEAWQQETEGVGHMTFMVRRKSNERMYACAQLSFFMLIPVRIPCTGNGASHSGYILLPPLPWLSRPPQTCLEGSQVWMILPWDFFPWRLLIVWRWQLKPTTTGNACSRHDRQLLASVSLTEIMLKKAIAQG